MLTNNERDYLVIMIDIQTAINTNNLELAQQAIASISALEENNEILNNSIIDVLNDTNIINNFASAEIFELLVDSIPAIKDKEHKHRVIELSSIVNGQDLEELSSWLETNALDSMDDYSESSMFMYTSLLIRACSITKQYSLMSQIRQKLVEVS